MNYYEILQISSDASDEVIKAAYKALAKKYHPDSNNFSADVCEKKMRELNLAFSVLSDQKKRKEYDSIIGSGQNRTNDFWDDSDYEETKGSASTSTMEESFDSETGKIFSGKRGIVREFLRAVDTEIKKNQAIVDNAYYDGMNMWERELVQQFKHSYGLKRSGYAKALEEKGLLYRGSDGNYIPTEEFKYYWR